MRGKQEKCCLSFAKMKMFGLPENYRQNFYFGLHSEDIQMFENAVCFAVSNPNPSEFPDFLFDNGFIEHFQVTSSSTNRKGAVHKREKSQFDMSVEEKITNEIFKVDETHYRFEYPEHSYDFFVESFKQTWRNHIESLKKYRGVKQHGIFLVEYNESALNMLEMIPPMLLGDLHKQEYCKHYRLSRDKNLLNFVFEYKDLIEFVMFVYEQGVEVIKLENVPELIKMLPWNYCIKAYPYIMETESFYALPEMCDNNE